jgi:hypothetical protein
MGMTMTSSTRFRIARRPRGCFLLIAGGILSLCLLALILSSLSNLWLPSHMPAPERLGEQDKARLAEALHLRNELGDELWPGWGGADIPMVLYNEEYIFLTGYPDPPDGWAAVPTGEVRGGAWEIVPDDMFSGHPYHRQALPGPDEVPQAFAVRIGGRWASSLPAYEWMEIGLGNDFRPQGPAWIAGFVPYRIAARLFLSAAGGKDLYICALLHESLHAFQGISAPDRLSAAETVYAENHERYPWADDAFAEDWQKELDLLADAVQAESDAEAAALAARFLDQRRERRAAAAMDSGLIALEQGKEWEEGLAKYTELSIWRLAAQTAAYRPLPAMALDPDFQGYAGFARQWSQQIDQIRRMADDDGDLRFYYSGMAQAALLDRLDPDWRETFLAGGDTLEELLDAAIR